MVGVEAGELGVSPQYVEEGGAMEQSASPGSNVVKLCTANS